MTLVSNVQTQNVIAQVQQTLQQRHGGRQGDIKRLTETSLNQVFHGGFCFGCRLCVIGICAMFGHSATSYDVGTHSKPFVLE